LKRAGDYERGASLRPEEKKLEKARKKSSKKRRVRAILKKSSLPGTRHATFFGGTSLKAADTREEGTVSSKEE